MRALLWIIGIAAIGIVISDAGGIREFVGVLLLPIGGLLMSRWVMKLVQEDYFNKPVLKSVDNNLSKPLVRLKMKQERHPVIFAAIGTILCFVSLFLLYGFCFSANCELLPAVKE